MKDGTGAFDFSKDVIGFRRPGKTFWVLIMFINIRHNRLDQLPGDSIYSTVTTIHYTRIYRVAN